MNKQKLFENVVSYSFGFFFVGTLIMMFFFYILKQTPPLTLSYFSITSFGVFLVTMLFNSFLSLKHIDIDYFRNVMIGISGGLAVWIFSGVDLAFEDGWLSINSLIVRLGFALMIILIGYSVCKKK